MRKAFRAVSLLTRSLSMRFVVGMGEVRARLRRENIAKNESFIVVDKLIFYGWSKESEICLQTVRAVGN